MKIEKLKTKTSAELLIELSQKKEKLFAYQLDLKSGKEKDSAKVKILRRGIAKILTLLNQKSESQEIDEVSDKTQKDKK